MFNTKKIAMSIFLLIAILVQSFSTGMIFVYASDEDYKGELRWDFIDGTDDFAVYKDNGTVNVSQNDSVLNINITSIASGKNAGIQYNQEFEIDRNYHDYIVFKADLPSNISKISAYLYDETQTAYKFGWGNNDNSIQAGITTGTNVYAFKLNEAHIGSGKPDTEVTDGIYNKLEIRFMTNDALSEQIISIDWVAFSKFNYGAIMCNGTNASSAIVGDRAKPSIINSFYVDEQIIELPLADEAYSVSEIYESSYNMFAELLDSVEVYYNDEYTNTSIEYMLTDKSEYKLLDITVNATKDEAETTRSYRVMIVSKPDPAPTIVINDCMYSNGVLDFSGYIMNARGDDYIRDEIVLVMAYEQDVGMGINGQNLKVWKTIVTDENGEFFGSIMIRDDETVSKLYTMQVAFCSAGAIEYEYVTYYNDKCIEALVSDMATKNDGIFSFMTTGLNKPAFESLGVSFQKYESYSNSDRTIINNNTKNNQAQVTVDNIVELANGTLLAFSSKKATNDTVLISTFDEFDENVMEIKLNGNTLKSFSKLDYARKKTIVSHFRSNLISTDYDDWFEFKNGILESMLLEYISTQRSSAAVKKAILDNKDIILYGNTSNDSDILKALESERKVAPDDAITYLLRKQEGAIFTDTVALLGAIETALEKTKGTDSETGGSAGGSGGGFGGGSSAGSQGGDDSFIVSGNNEAINNGKEVIEDFSTKRVFTDLENYEWAEKSIEYLTEKGIVSGIGNGKFEPSRAVTREEFIKLLCEAFELKSADEDTDFTDVPKDAWYKNYVSCAVANGIVNGISNDVFGSGMQITREDMAVLIYRALRFVNKDINSEIVKFIDYDETANYAQEAVGLLAGAGIVNGVGNGSFAPKAVASRAEASVIIYRCIELLGK